LALALRADDAVDRLDLDEAAALRYLAGETIEGPGPSGWLLLTVRGFPLGWGRRHGATVKNHYPKGLRRPLT
jgi:NOL1/NOP2/fmu family ribosome biogenesis protein